MRNKHQSRAQIDPKPQSPPIQQPLKSNETAPRRDPPSYSSSIEVIAASQSSQSAQSAQVNRTSSRSVSNSTVCFQCGKTGHISSTCSHEGKPPRRCHACGGIGHFAKFCSTRVRQQQSQSAEPIAKSSNAVSFAGTRAPQLFTEAVI